MTTTFIKTINYSIHIILFLLFSLLASVYIPGVKHPTQIGKFLIFSFTVTGLFLLYVCTIFSRTYSTKLKAPDVLLLLTLIFIIINRYILQPHCPFSIRFCELVGLSAVYIVLRYCAVNIDVYLLIAVITGGIFQSVYGNLQLYGLFPSNHILFNLTGSFFNPGPYAGYLVSVLPAAVGMYLFRNNINLTRSVNNQAESLLSSKNKLSLRESLIRFVALAGIITLLLILPATQSRAAWLGALSSSVFLLFHYCSVPSLLSKYLNNKAKKGLVIAGSFFIALFLIAGLYFFKKGSVNGRFLIWKITANMIKDKPLTGYGFDSFQANYMNYQEAYFHDKTHFNQSNVASDVNYAFNEFLQCVSENGLIVGFLVVFFLILIFRIKNESNKHLLLIGKAGIISIVVFSLFSYPAQILPIKLNAVLYLTIILGSCTASGFNVKINRWIKIVVLTFSLGGVFFLVKNIVKVHQAYTDWDTAYAIYLEEEYTESLYYYQRAYRVLNNEGTFLMQYGKALSLNGDHEKAVKILERSESYLNNTVIQAALGDSYKALRRYNEAEKRYLKAWHMSPGRFYPKYLLAKLYNETGQREKAISTARQLLAKKMKVKSVAINEMLDELKKMAQHLPKENY